MIASPADILDAVYQDLHAWARARKGICVISSGPDNLFDLLREPPPTWRVILHWEGDENVNTSVRAGNVAVHHYRFVVDGSVGPTAVPNIGLVRSTASRSPLLGLVNDIRARVLGYRFPWLDTQNNHFVYEGSDDKVPLPDGLFLAAYNLLFSLPSKFQQAEEQIDLPIPEVTNG